MSSRSKRSGPASPLPGAVFTAFPRLESPGGSDVAVLEMQLGREPRGEIFVACRCPHGLPAVILTVPFAADDGPAPPLLWLSCPSAAAAAGRLEGAKGIARLAEALDADGALRSRFMDDEERFAAALEALAEHSGAPPERYHARGAAGGGKGAVKCLHAHLAYALASRGGAAGGWILHVIEEKGGTWCEKVPEACLS